MMHITVDLAGQLSRSLPQHQALEVPLGTTTRQAAERLGLNLEEIGLITIDGVQSEFQDELKPGCRLCFFPYLSGG
jgi:molybdopterin converting factor small subunit